MKIEQIYTGCLAQGAYYITSNGEAAIIDPLRETKPYLEKLKKDNVTLKYIFETHFHADFVSGHVDLSQQTGAAIVYGPTANPEFDAIVASDNQEFKIGALTIIILHTPGHTLESSTFLLLDEENKEHAIFTGDTLFLGDVGRPDLAQKAANLTQEELAGLLYDSIYTKILSLPDTIVVYPGHGAGSACGKNMMKETVDTLGNQRTMNYALNQPNREAFIKAVTDGLTPPPGYFGMNVSMNKKGYQAIDTVLKHGNKPLSVSEFEAIANATHAVILDTRDSNTFANGFIPNAINIGINGDFAPWVGTMLVDVAQPILIVTDNKVEDILIRLSRIGFDNVLGYLENGFEQWKQSGKEIDTIDRISAIQFEQEFKEDSIVYDVRKATEYEAEHIVDAYSKPLAYINDWIQEIDSNKPFYIHCAGGYRSMIAASLLQARGIRNFKEIEGGFNQIATTVIPKTNFVCPSKQYQLN